MTYFFLEDRKYNLFSSVVFEFIGSYSTDLSFGKTICNFIPLNPIQILIPLNGVLMIDVFRSILAFEISIINKKI